MKRKLTFTVPPEYEGKKLFYFLRGHAGLSHRLLTSLKQLSDGIMRGGELIRTIDKIHAGDEIVINLPVEETQVEPSGKLPEPLYRDEDIMVIDKPAGIAMHPTHNHQGDTLANMVAAYLKENNSSGVFRSIGRLDKNTSGLVLCALNQFSASALSEALLKRDIQKTYYAVAEGEYSGSGTIDIPIYRPDPMKTLRAAGEEGDRAVTHWECIKSGSGLSLLKIRLETGRTHQIRVHFSHLGTPLAGDDMYGGSTELIKRHALHCADLSFMHPISGERMNIHADIPSDMHKLIDLMG